MKKLIFLFIVFFTSFIYAATYEECIDEIKKQENFYLYITKKDETKTSFFVLTKEKLLDEFAYIISCYSLANGDFSFVESLKMPLNGNIYASALHSLENLYKFSKDNPTNTSNYYCCFKTFGKLTEFNSPLDLDIEERPLGNLRFSFTQIFSKILKRIEYDKMSKELLLFNPKFPDVAKEILEDCFATAICENGNYQGTYDFYTIEGETRLKTLFLRNLANKNLPMEIYSMPKHSTYIEATSFRNSEKLGEKNIIFEKNRSQVASFGANWDRYALRFFGVVSLSIKNEFNYEAKNILIEEDIAKLDIAEIENLVLKQFYHKGWGNKEGYNYIIILYLEDSNLVDFELIRLNQAPYKDSLYIYKELENKEIDQKYIEIDSFYCNDGRKYNHFNLSIKDSFCKRSFYLKEKFLDERITILKYYTSKDNKIQNIILNVNRK